MIHLLDGSAYIHRAYHAMPPLTTSTGTPCGAIHGLCATLAKTLAHALDSGATHVAVVFDGGSARRRARYADYKGNRSPKPDDLLAQFPLAKEACDAFGIAAVHLPGEEADDVIATYATVAVNTGRPAMVYSIDKDLMQLLALPGVRMFDPMQGREVTTVDCERRFGVPPGSLREALALIGDAVDNIPGVSKIGVKTAANLVRQYGTVERIIAHRGAIGGAVGKNLGLYAEAARLSHELIGLVTDLPVPPLMRIAVTRPDPKRLDAFLQRMEFEGLRSELVSRMALYA